MPYSSQIMSFSNKVVLETWERSAGRCERCRKQLSFESRGRKDRGNWEAHSRSGLHLDSTSDCSILCWDCHKATY